MAAHDSTSSVVAGIDIGGTKLSVCVGDSQGRVLAHERWPMDRDAEPTDLLGEALRWLERLDAAHRPVALGVACPGPLTLAGRFLDPPNMPRWHGFDVASWLRAQQALPVHTMNDANAAVVAEVWWGAARGARNAVFCTMSTGMGAGLWLNGALHPGKGGFGGEIGHIRLADDGPVGFGKRGSVEGFLSGPGMSQVGVAEARVALQRGEASALLYHGAPRADLDAEVLCRLAASGDPAALRAVRRSAEKLGSLLAILVDLLDLEVAVLGTIGSAHLDLFLPGALEVLRAEALRHSLAGFEVVGSTLGARRGDLQALAAACYGELGPSASREASGASGA
ncbi:MAG: ROK family protein [Planctomycetota bacterium]